MSRESLHRQQAHQWAPLKAVGEEIQQNRDTSPHLLQACSLVELEGEWDLILAAMRPRTIRSEDPTLLPV